MGHDSDSSKPPNGPAEPFPQAPTPIPRDSDLARRPHWDIRPEDLTFDEYGYLVMPWQRIIPTPEQQKALALLETPMEDPNTESTEGAAQSNTSRHDPPPEKG
jgi:hypothetical protein